MRIISALLLLLAIVPVRAGDTPDFSRYPQTEAFRLFVQRQTNAVARPSSSINTPTIEVAHLDLLAITAFDCSAIHGNVATVYDVSQDGSEEDCRIVYRWAIQANHSNQLSVDDVKRLRSAISKLPAHNESPPLDRLMIVSFPDGTNWVTRTYDWQAPPKAMGEIETIIGARF